MVTVEYVAGQLLMDPEDIRYFVSLLVDLDGDELPDVISAECKMTFSPCGERTVPELYGLTPDSVD